LNDKVGDVCMLVTQPQCNACSHCKHSLLVNKRERVASTASCGRTRELDQFSNHAKFQGVVNRYGTSVKNRGPFLCAMRSALIKHESLRIHCCKAMRCCARDCCKYDCSARAGVNPCYVIRTGRSQRCVPTRYFATQQTRHHPA
jgi:hypothetical protein